MCKLHLRVPIQQVAVQVLLMLAQVCRLLVDDDGETDISVDNAADQGVEARGAGVGIVERHFGSHWVAAEVTVVHGCGLALARGVWKGFVSFAVVETAAVETTVGDASVIEAAVVGVKEKMFGKEGCNLTRFLGSWWMGCGRKGRAARMMFEFARLA